MYITNYVMWLAHLIHCNYFTKTLFPSGSFSDELNIKAVELIALL